MEDKVHSMTDAAKEGQQQPGAVKQPPEPIKETPVQIIARLEQEKADLEHIIHSQPKLSAEDSKYMSDVDFLAGEKNKSTGNKIVLKDITDHKNISLWTAWGKRIGPMHPTNATFVYHKFRRLGRMLFVRKPTEEQIQAYYKTPKYIGWKKKFDADRIRKNASKKGDGLNKTLDAMAKITGENRKDLMKILDKPAGIQT